ncbi:helix-turn-helix domain-containing protein [Aeromonas veronii]|nr:helix-turn-helix domain-containing protein [Aeromonas veronii]
MEKRDEVLYLVSQGQPKAAIARRLGISGSSVHRIVKGSM